MLICAFLAYIENGLVYILCEFELDHRKTNNVVFALNNDTYQPWNPPIL